VHLSTLRQQPERQNHERTKGRKRENEAERITLVPVSLFRPFALS
jgi:hypothetical protein